MSAERRGLLAQAIDRGLVELVGINEVKFLAFGQPKLGAIVAHVGPNILGSEEPDSFIQLASNKMDELELLYSRNKNYFTVNSNANVICATFHDTPPSPEQAAVFRERLRKLGLPIVKDCSYERSSRGLTDEARPEGTVWVVKRKDTSTMVYLEDKIITPNLAASSSRISESALPRTSASGATIWTRRHGENEYKLRNSAGEVVQQTEEVPRGVWIQLYSQDSKLQKTAMWNGSDWKYR